MIEQLKTIREALALGIKAINHLGGAREAMPLHDAMPALAQLEAMMGSQEPVMWAMPKGDGTFIDVITPAEHAREEGSYTVPLFAHPVAQQYEAGDVASAAAQGFRDGVASVTQQEQKPVAETESLRLAGLTLIGLAEHDQHCEVFDLDDEGKHRDCTCGLADAIATITQAGKTAAPVAQQPNEWSEAVLDWLAPTGKDFPTDTPPREIVKWLMNFEHEVAQQPQARPDFADEWTGYLKDGETPFERFLRERKDLGALTKLYQRALEENERLKAQQPQAKPHKPLFADLIAQHPGLREELLEMDKQPQAEAVPPDVVRDAAPIPDHELVTMYDERPTSDLEMIEFAREVERRHGIGVQPKHITDGSPCWCNPDVAYTDPETGASVIVHRRPQ